MTNLDILPRTLLSNLLYGQCNNAVCAIILPHSHALRGTEQFFGLDGEVEIVNSTLGKALGGAAGGYTTGSRELIDLLRQRSRPYLFSNSLPPPVVAAASKVGVLSCHVILSVM